MTNTAKYTEDKQGNVAVLRHPVSQKMIGTVRLMLDGRYLAINWRKEKQPFTFAAAARGWIGECATGDGELNL